MTSCTDTVDRKAPGKGHIQQGVTKKSLVIEISFLNKEFWLSRTLNDNLMLEQKNPKKWPAPCLTKSYPPPPLNA